MCTQSHTGCANMLLVAACSTAGCSAGAAAGCITCCGGLCCACAAAKHHTMFSRAVFCLGLVCFATTYSTGSHVLRALCCMCAILYISASSKCMLQHPVCAACVKSMDNLDPVLRRNAVKLTYLRVPCTGIAVPAGAVLLQLLVFCLVHDGAR